MFPRKDGAALPHTAAAPPLHTEAAAPRKAPPLLPAAWSANLTVTRGGKEEYHGSFAVSYGRCAGRTLELGSARTSNHPL